MFLVSSAFVFTQSTETRCWAENDDVVGAAPTGAYMRRENQLLFL